MDLSCQMHVQGALSKEVPLHAISAANTEVAIFQPSAGAKVRGTSLTMSVENKEGEQQSMEC